MMVDSQKEATAAALTELGYDVDAQLAVHSFTRGLGLRGRPRGGRRDPRGERHAGDGCRAAARDRQRGRRRSGRAR